jgi:hypothetical protein
MIGTSALGPADPALIQAAGIGWVREDAPFPFRDRIGGELAEGYLEVRERYLKWSRAGLKVMGVTPLPGIGTRKADASGYMGLKWTDFFPAWMGKPGSGEYHAAYEAVCAFLASDLRGKVQAWQICNELDIEQFAGPLDPRQACDLVLAGARGLKRSDPSLVVGHNPAGADKAYFFFGRLFGREDRLVDYCGIDGYYGSWARGGPGEWERRIAELHALTGAPILVNEWGFASRGGVMEEAERLSGTPACQLRKWPHTWGKGHTPEGQAEFVTGALASMARRKSELLGAFFYRWEDQETCWQCGSPDCPCETAWGLVDLAGKPKPAWHAFKEGVGRLVGGG